MAFVITSEHGLAALTQPPLIVHLVYRFATGGIENGLVNLINHLPANRYRHAVVALTEVTDFQSRIHQKNVEYYSLNKPPGPGLWQFSKLFKLFRQLRPAIIHTRNIAALEAQLPAWVAQVPVRIHGEHGRDISDLDGENLNLQRVRRAYKRFVTHYTSLSPELTDYLVRKIHVPPTMVTQACNGVDTSVFYPAANGVQFISGSPFDPSQHWIVGTVGRMESVKDQTMLVHAFIQALNLNPALKQRMRLVMIGDGPLRCHAQALLDNAGLSHLAWLPGTRDDIPAVMRGLHLFILPSLAEGICNTLLEAMASGLPVIATAVGGNGSLVVHGLTGRLVESGNPLTMARELVEMAANPALAQRMGIAGRQRVLEFFSLQSMISVYERLYDQELLKLDLNF